MRCTCMRRYARLGCTVREPERENRAGGKVSARLIYISFSLGRGYKRPQARARARAQAHRSLRDPRRMEPNLNR